MWRSRLKSNPWDRESTAKLYDVGFNLKILGCWIWDLSIQGVWVWVWKEKKQKRLYRESSHRFETRNSSRHTSISAKSWLFASRFLAFSIMVSTIFLPCCVVTNACTAQWESGFFSICSQNCKMRPAKTFHRITTTTTTTVFLLESQWHHTSHHTILCQAL